MKRGALQLSATAFIGAGFSNNIIDDVYPKVMHSAVEMVTQAQEGVTEFINWLTGVEIPDVRLPEKKVEPSFNNAVENFDRHHAAQHDRGLPDGL